ncbi:hypothetical protein DL93DRAFT_2233903 [Clavulina sp. PMI_390]|nr:hypothetical protein DL93DRAFT_2233903 [Clavulina sp. PMI_390]
MPTPLATMDKRVTDFVKKYYSTLDSWDHSSKDLEAFYDDRSVLMWEGGFVPTRTGIIGFLRKMPSMKHKVDSIEADGDEYSSVAEVVGKLTMGEDEGRSYKETFIITVHEDSSLALYVSFPLLFLGYFLNVED